MASIAMYQDVIFNESINGATAYTSSVSSVRSTGNTALKIVSSAGTLAITQQCSADKGKTWQDPTDGAGNALGAVLAAGGVGTYYIVPSVVVSPLIRYKVVESTAATTVTITYIQSEEGK